MDRATTFLHNRLAYGQTKTDSLVVQTSSSLQLSKLLEQLAEVLFGDTDSGVFDLYYHALGQVTVPSLDLDLTVQGEL